jgi:hypothetical protein
VNIDTFNNDRGCWDTVKTVERLFTVEDRSFLCFSWCSRVYEHGAEYCIRAVNEAKEMLQNNPSCEIRVYWYGDVLWQNGQWKIDTRQYDFSVWGEPC